MYSRKKTTQYKLGPGSRSRGSIDEVTAKPISDRDEEIKGSPERDLKIFSKTAYPAQSQLIAYDETIDPGSNQKSQLANAGLNSNKKSKQIKLVSDLRTIAREDFDEGEGS